MEAPVHAQTAAPDASCRARIFQRCHRWLVLRAEQLQSPLLLAVRLYWGWQFFLTGRGKLMNHGKVTEFFHSLHIPFPSFNVWLAGGTECCGGLLLLAGLCSRLTSLPLIFVTLIAYLTAELDTVKNIFSAPDKFVSADPFLFMLAAILVLAFGPGTFSLDWLVQRKFFGKSKTSQS